jgi:hypothetical protein
VETNKRRPCREAAKLRATEVKAAPAVPWAKEAKIYQLLQANANTEALAAQPAFQVKEHFPPN